MADVAVNNNISVNFDSHVKNNDDEIYNIFETNWVMVSESEEGMEIAAAGHGGVVWEEIRFSIAPIVLDWYPEPHHR